MTEPEFTDLLRRFEKGQCTPEERDVLERWLDAHDNEQAPFISEGTRMQVKDALRKSIFRETGLSSERQGSAFLNPPRTRRQGAFGPWTLLRIAASFLVVALVGYGALWYTKSMTEANYATTAINSGADIVKVHLSDSSIIWLKPHSSLQYPRQFKSTGNRSVLLQGEALFEVERKITQPFIVNAGALTATVLGTSFNIKATDAQVEVVVLTGRVSVTSTTDKEGMVVSPDESVVYNTFNKLLTKVDTPMEEAATEAIVAGTQYDMNFSETRMRDVIKRIEGKFNVTVNISDPAIGNCIITADFTGQPLMKTMGIIAQALAIQYHIESGTVTLTGKGCK